MSRFKELAVSVTAIGDALRDIESLHQTAQTARAAFDRLHVVGHYGNQPRESEIPFAKVMTAAGEAMAKEVARKARSAALAAALATIHSHRAILCSLAAAATVELAEIARDAQEKG